jgi:hypothetical protein
MNAVSPRSDRLGRRGVADHNLGRTRVGLAGDDDWIVAFDHVARVEVPRFSFGQAPRVDLDLEMSSVWAGPNDTDPEKAAMCRPGETLGFAYKF